jgi:hypothetical protein
MLRTRRTFAFAFYLSVALTVALDASAQTRTEKLRWTHPSPSDVTGYQVYWGDASRDYGDSTDVGIPDIVSGAFEYEITVDAGADVWVAVTAYNAEAESFYSNGRCRGPVGECDPGSAPPPDPGPEPTPQASAAVVGFVLWDAEADSVIDSGFESGEQISLSDHACTAIEIVGNGYLANSGSPGSVMYAFDGQAPNGCSDPGTSHENNPPFAWEWEAGPGQFDCAPTLTEPGSHTLTVTPFDGDDCTALQGAPVVLEFEVLASPPASPSPPDPLGAPGRPMLVLD